MIWPTWLRTRYLRRPDVLRRPATLPSGPSDEFAGTLRPDPTADVIIDLNQPFPASQATATPFAGRSSGRPHPFGSAELREAVARTAGVEPASVLVTPGATAAFHTALAALVRPGRPVVLLAPGSPLFHPAAVANRARVRWVRTWVEGGRLRFDFDALSRAMRGAALFAAADPANPLGAPLADEDAERLAWAAERSDVPMYVDETFRRFRGPAGPRLAELAPGRTLAAGSVSALGSLARVGWLTGPADLVRGCGLAQSLTTPFVPPACQDLALRALAAGDPLPGLATLRRDAVARLCEMGLATADPHAGYFLWADVSGTGRTGRAFAGELLTAEGVRVGPGDRHGPDGERFVRLSLAAEPGRLREGLTRLARFVGFKPPRPEPAPRPAVTRRPAFSRG